MLILHSTASKRFNPNANFTHVVINVITAASSNVAQNSSYFSPRSPLVPCYIFLMPPPVLWYISPHSLLPRSLSARFSLLDKCSEQSEDCWEGTRRFSSYCLNHEGVENPRIDTRASGALASAAGGGGGGSRALHLAPAW